MKGGLTVKRILEVFEKKGANVTVTCKALGISRDTFYRYADQYPRLKQGIKEVKEGLIDFAESKLTEQISNGNITAIIFFLKTIGRDRGYVERIETEVSSPFLDLMQRAGVEDEESEDR